MFEILYKICSSLEPDTPSGDLEMKKYSLIPLYTDARQTQIRFRTPMDYYPYDADGALWDPKSFLNPFGGNVAEPVSRLSSYMRELCVDDDRSSPA